MVRWTDLIGVAGFALVIVSTTLLFPSSAEQINWKYMLGGIAVWLLGFVSVVGWVLLRFSVRPFKEGPPPLLTWSIRPRKRKETSRTNDRSTRAA
jgi:hypothetical protein